MSERGEGETYPKVRLLASPETTDVWTLRGWTDAPGNLVKCERMHHALNQVASLCTGESPANVCPLPDARDLPRAV
jgi:hypothetical protein